MKKKNKLGVTWIFVRLTFHYGMSVDKTYAEIIKDNKGKNVIVVMGTN